MAVVLATSVGLRAGAPATQPAAPPAAQRTAIDAPDDLVQNYCVDCHNDDNKKNTGGLSLQSFAIAKVGDMPSVGERMVRKLRAGMMPPPGTTPPNAASMSALITELETRLDAAAAAHPNAGSRTFQRLNRHEYAEAVRELVALDVDPGQWLPLDSMSANFDNIADEQMLSATLLDAYLNAATDISRMAVGDRSAAPVDRTYVSSIYASQHPWDHVEGAPFGTRGGLVVQHVFPADAEYVFEPVFTAGTNARFEDLDLSIDGERVALVKFEPQPAQAADGRGGTPMRTEPILVRAGQHTVAAAFVRRMDGPYEDLIRPHDWSYAGGGSGGTGITVLPHLQSLSVRGPYRVTGVSNSPSRQKVFVCRPLSAGEERPCARQIAERLGAIAYRRPLSPADAEALLKFYDLDAPTLGFEAGVRGMLEAILASPHFIFRLERAPAGVKPGTSYRLSGTDIASRLSFFLWGTPPDAVLTAAAAKGELATTAGLEAQAKRMLADPRAEAIGRRFAGQWLRLQDLDKNHPDPNFFPNFNNFVAEAMKTETTLFFNDLVRSDRSALELIRANYTFVNARLASFYGMPGVAGDEFRKVNYPDDRRRGILGQGSMLVQTSLANRTSPVLRGKWVMEVLLGTPPPPPPPNVPPLDNTAESKDNHPLTTRERMEMHRSDPTCRSCHRFMDPIGLALDQFDVTGKWRLHENGSALDTRGTFYDGTEIASPAQLSAALLKRPLPLVRTLTENLMAFALGRRVEYFDQPTIRAIVRHAEPGEYPVRQLILGVIKSDAFVMKRADTVPATGSSGTPGRPRS